MPTILVHDGFADMPRKVTAPVIRGVWAMHNTLLADGSLSIEEWSVSHIPSGACVVKRTTRERAHSLILQLPEGWAAEVPFGPASAQEAVKRPDAHLVKSVLDAWKAGG